jgi:very-short-patch-repair endonuclease
MSESQAEHLDAEVRRIVDAARVVWVRRLIDYSRANSLLFYRDLRVGTLDLSAETRAVERLLAGEALAPDSLESRSSVNNDDAVSRLRAEAGVLLKMRQSLVTLQRKALSNLEEKGIETLFLALGLATWPAADGGRPYSAPVLLLPARIEMRGRAGSEIRLAVAGEPLLNAVLSECSAEDETGHWRIDPERVFGSIEREAAGVASFQVNRRVILANFHFAKMAIIEDLKNNADALAQSTIVAAVAGHLRSRQELGAAVVDIDPAGLDERPASRDYLVLDADGTQQRAIVLAGCGQSGVIQGPPGTGKSQTIANLIAQNVAEGRRILFVAEKRAALDAVIKRLEHPDIGLGHLILDLHGASVSRKEVMARLAGTLEQIRHALPVDGVEAVHSAFDERRRRLNEHARRVRAPRQPTGFSVYDMMGRLLRLPKAAKSGVRFRGRELAALTPDRTGEVDRWLLDGAAHPTLLLGTDSSPWNRADIQDGRSAQDAIDLAVRSATSWWPAFEALLGATVLRLRMRSPSTLSETADFLELLCDVRLVLKNYSPAVFELGVSELAQALEPAAGSPWARAWAFLTDSKYRAAQKKLLSLRVEPTPVAQLLEEARRAQDVLERWRGFAIPPETPVDATGVEELGEAFTALHEATTKLGAVTHSSFDGMSLVVAAARLRALAEDQRTPYRLPGVNALRASLEAAGLRELLDDLSVYDVPPEHWRSRFAHVLLHSALEQVLAEDSSLASFSGRTHEQIIADFVRLDRERLRLAAERVRRLHGERAVQAMNEHFDQANLIKSEARKKSRHLPLRALLTRAPDVLTRIAPCWVASPLSVSQLLDGSRRHFDIVVFDEASQILQEEAIPALYRAGQVVAAGDRHQLPPTTFFATSIEEEEDTGAEDEAGREAQVTATAAVGGFESLLDTLDAFLPNWPLDWHYRSEDERLISFSNQHIYSGRLITFPSARDQEVIRHGLVPHDARGAQEESASREVEEVVRQVLRHAAEKPGDTLGVITMGIKHANRVQACLDRELALRPELSDFFSLDREERFFVKNLETVQGDERDAIILTIGYGKSANGDLPHRFGPLTQDAGHRRLNVAVTRAKRRVTAISSFSSQDVDLNRSGSRGVQLLKAYLEFAASGGTRLPEAEQAGKVPLNAFEADIRDALEARGLILRPQFGASRYRIDLAAMHPRKPGRPVLAIECDGASYHSSGTARDRDRRRQEHLQRLGWRFHRIWSIDWFFSREEEMDRAVAAYEDAVRWADQANISTERVDAEPSERPGPSTPEVSPRRGPRPLGPPRESIENYSERELRHLAEWIVSDGLLRTDDELVSELFKELPFQRLGPRIRMRLEATVQWLRR